MAARKMQGSKQAMGIFGAIASFFSHLFVMFGGILAYVPQYAQMNLTNNADGFSIYVSLALVLASTLKFCYWFKIPYDTALFGQAIVNIFVMLAMLELRTRILHRQRVIPEEEKRALLDWDFSYFWDWTELISYIQAIVFFTVFFGFIVTVFGQVPGVMIVLGYLAAGFETAMTLPQLISNFNHKSTAGLNKEMVGLWILADTLKVGYLAMNDVPFAFLLCGILQMCVDAIIGGQIFYYGDGSGGPDSPTPSAPPQEPPEPTTVHEHPHDE